MNAIWRSPECFCQNESLLGYYRYLPKHVALAIVLGKHVQQFGISQSLEWFLPKLYRRALVGVGLKGIKRPNQPEVADEGLNLQPGELVEVKRTDEILATLDKDGKQRGLLFSTDMREYCGRRMRVFKRVEKICLEARPGRFRKLKNTVLLEGCICHGCDRAAFLFWRECWLKRVDPAEVDPPID